jgi:hypothetical protein
VQGILDQCAQEEQKQIVVILLICHIFSKILWTTETYVYVCWRNDCSREPTTVRFYGHRKVEHLPSEVLSAHQISEWK